MTPGRNARQRRGATGRINDLTARDGMWHRFAGDDWAAFDALPLPVRRRLHEHAYDGWAVNALMLWRTLRRRHASTVRALNTLLRYLGECENLERAAFAASHMRSFGSALPHVAARASVLRFDPPRRLTRRARQPTSPTWDGPACL